MRANVDEAVLNRYVAEVYNEGKVTAVEELVSDELRIEHPASGGSINGPAGFTTFIQELRSAYPDLRLQINEMSSQGTRITARVTVRDVYPLPQTGIALFEVRDGKIAVDTAAEDLLGYLYRRRDSVERRGTKPRRRRAD
jgi:predicted ester cyclase